MHTVYYVGTSKDRPAPSVILPGSQNIREHSLYFWVFSSFPLTLAWFSLFYWSLSSWFFSALGTTRRAASRRAWLAGASRKWPRPTSSTPSPTTSARTQQCSPGRYETGSWPKASATRRMFPASAQLTGNANHLDSHQQKREREK